MSARILRSMELYLGQALFLVTAAAAKVNTALGGIYKVHMLLFLDLLIRPALVFVVRLLACRSRQASIVLER